MAGNGDRGRTEFLSLPPLGLTGDLGLPTGVSRGIVIFAHGSGSSRLSPRNTFVARELQKSGFATLLFDLLSESEAADRTNVFDIALLAARLVEATEWVRGAQMTRTLPIGYFGASTGAAAALVAGARPRSHVSAIVSRGGRPDLAGGALAHVKAPTLLIVGGADRDVLSLNSAALRRLHCEAKLEIIPDATHLFEEPGALGEVVRLAAHWFLHHLGAAAT
jgi:putative phosphoribosyl transferase